MYCKELIPLALDSSHRIGAGALQSTLTEFDYPERAILLVLRRYETYRPHSLRRVF